MPASDRIHELIATALSQNRAEDARKLIEQELCINACKLEAPPRGR